MTFSVGSYRIPSSGPKPSLTLWSAATPSGQKDGRMSSQGESETSSSPATRHSACATPNTPRRCFFTDGCVRVKKSLAAGGQGQQRFQTSAELTAALEKLPADELREYGLVLE